MKNNRLTLKALKAELDNLKKSSSSTKNVKVHPSILKVGGIIDTSTPPRSSIINKGKLIFQQSSMFYLWVISGILGYARKLPVLSKFITLLSLWYGKTTWWKILIKIRKIFIIFNALLGVLLVFKTTGFSTDNILAGFSAIGYTYIEILTNFTKRLFRWFVELFDHKVVPNMPGESGYFSKPSIPELIASEQWGFAEDEEFDTFFKGLRFNKDLNIKITVAIIKSITKPKLIEEPKTLLISKPSNDISVYFHEYDLGLRCLNLHIINPDLYESRVLLEGIFNAITTHKAFINFGNIKSIILSAVMHKEMKGEYNLHHNVLIDSTTTFNQYYNEVGNIVNSKLDHGYSIEVIEYYKVKVWNLDLMKNSQIKLSNKGKIDFLGYRSFSTSSSCLAKRGNISISPINVDKTTNKFGTMDIETMNINGIQTPVAISTCNGHMKKDSNLFLIDHLLLQTNPELALSNLWKSYFDYILKSGVNLILVHNLGNFDGYFLYKGLLNHFDPILVESLIDDSKSFISISLNINDIKIVWKDSLRIFPVSLDKLCEIFGLEGKLSKYDIRFNDISLFKSTILWSKFKKYALQDAIALYKALFTAQSIYFNDFNIDLTTIFSSPTLSLKIFRSKFLKHSIPILSKNVDEFIRCGYYGGATDFYKSYDTNLKYYDVNSLYPNAMKNPMPLNLIKYHKSMYNVNLNDFFGFIEVEVTCPNTMLKPLLPFKYEGKTIYPTGSWRGIYFSEELKAMIPLGYKFKLWRGFEFSKINLFDSYVDHFFNIKLNSTGAQKAIAKLHLNGLYGYFGRRQDLIETINVSNSSLSKYLASRIVKEMIKINDNYSTLLLSDNINHKVLMKLNMICESNIQATNKIVMSNVAIAAAVTAYARIHMIYYKLLPGTVYTDTDSIFTTDELPNHLIGKGLGLMKDELNGLFIQEGYFLGLKKYGYWYLDKDNNRIEQSVFAGITRNSLTFNEIIELYEGSTIHRDIDSRFYKSFTNLDISIKPANISIHKSDRKELVDNIYLPPHIVNGQLIRPYDVTGSSFNYFISIDIY